MSSNEFNLIRIEALEKRIQELETQLKIETIKPPTRFKKQTNGKPTKCNKL